MSFKIVSDKEFKKLEKKPGVAYHSIWIPNYPYLEGIVDKSSLLNDQIPVVAQSTLNKSVFNHIEEQNRISSNKIHSPNRPKKSFLCNLFCGES